MKINMRFTGEAASKVGIKFSNEQGQEINTVDFGELREGKKKRFLVKIKNIGNVPLLVEYDGYNCNQEK